MVKNNIINNIPNLKKTEGRLGVEIEVEGSRLPNSFPCGTWKIDLDPSLKHGLEAYEYIMPRPLPLAGVKTSLDTLKKYYKLCDSKVVDTVTSGVHVHLNVQEYSIKELFTFLTCYYILEDVLTGYCGPNREGNHFCLRAQDAEYILFRLVEVAKTKNLKYLNTENIRYASLNLFSLFKYGSVEFRAMRGTSDLDAIYKWCEIIVSLADEAKNFDDPLSVITSFSGDGELIFLKHMLGTHSDLFMKEPNLEQKIRSGARRAQIIAYATDWALFKDEKINPFKKAQL